MANFKPFPLFVLILNSCALESIPDDGNFQGRWELHRTMGNFIQSERRGNDLEFDEFYTFKRNGQFIKERSRTGDDIIISGSYKSRRPGPEDPEDHLLYLDLSFPVKSSLTANCTNDPVETLVLTKEHLLFNNWIACDGLFTEYKRKSNFPH